MRIRNTLLRRALPLLFAATALLCIFAPAAGAVPGPDLGLTDAESDYIRDAGTLRVGYVQDRIPVSFSDENGDLAGISRSIFDRVQALTGLTFEYVPLPAGSITYDYLTEQKLDLVTSVEYNEENKRANGILISEPYLTSRKVVVAPEGLSFHLDAAYKVAVSTGSQTLRKVLSAAFPNFSLVDYDSITDCFDAICAGQADLLIQNQYVVEYWIGKPAYEQLKVIPVPGMDDRLCFSAVVAFDGGPGSSPQQGQTLIDILDKAIAAISDDEISTYTIQAIMDNQYELTLGDFLYRYRHMALILSIAAIVIATLAALLIRQRVLAMQELADAKARDQFLSTMSHEIRTPLNGLIGLNYLMRQKTGEPEKLAEYLRQSDATARYLQGLVSDMLDMSRLQGRQMQLASQPVDLANLVATVEAIARPGMEEKGLWFQADAVLGQSWVMGDELRIQQVLLNLLDNARKFTAPGGHVTLEVDQTTGDDGGLLTRAVVTDTGRGMGEEFQKHIFESFAKEMDDDAVSKGNEGTGLGLPICRQLAEMMGGSLTFTSRKNEGSRFQFVFPCVPAEAPPAQEEPLPVHEDQAAPHGAVLVAEDNELNGEIMLDLLQDAGLRADLAQNGRIALEVFRRSAIGTYDAILMDLLMPEMDGFQAAQAIRALDRPDARTVRIIACTANAADSDRERAQASGMDGFLTKPVDIGKLLDMLGGL